MKLTPAERKTKDAPARSATPEVGGRLQRKCRCGAPVGLTSECAQCGEKFAVHGQTHSHNENHEAPTIVHQVLQSAGQPLDAGTRSELEPRFGYDFGHVRVHADQKAAQSAQAVNAQAYTVGPDIVFGEGQYGPQTTKGRKLLSHELAHVVQQRQHNNAGRSLKVGAADDAHEREADEISSRVGGDGDVFSGIQSSSVIPTALQRQPVPNAPSPGPATPGPTPAGPTAVLANGQVVQVEIRESSGAVTEFSHEYPIDLAGNIEIPTAGTIAATGKTLAQLRQDIHAAFSPSILVNPTVNVSLSSKTVTYTRTVAVGDTVRIRVLGGSGQVDPSTGSYTVDTDGKLHVPFVGDIAVAGMTLSAIENQIETAIRNGFILNAVVHVSIVQLNS